jgi:phosphatidate cytidylyltransferase
VLKTRLLTALVAIPALWLIVRYLPAPLFAGFIVAVAAVALYEYFEMAIPDHAEERGLGVGWGILVAAAVVSGQPQLLGAGLALAVVLGLILPLVRTTDPLGATQRLGLSLLGVLYFGFLTAHIVLLRSGDNGWRWVLFTVFTAMGSDSGGYFAGRAFGRHKLAPAVSPSKTVEGGMGAIAGAVLIAVFAKVFIIPQLGVREAMALGAVVSVLAQLGDLCESALKRAFGAKDSGWIIPGHGGILDRLDSLLFPIVFAYYYAALPRF